MGHADIVFPSKLIVVDYVLFEFGAVVAEKIAGRRHRHDGYVEKVRRTAHHAVAGVGPVGHHHTAASQILSGLGNQERQADLLPRRGRCERHLSGKGRIVLHVVQPRHRFGAVSQPGEGGYVGNAFAVKPDFPGLLLQSSQIFITRTRRHGLSPGGTMFVGAHQVPR